MSHTEHADPGHPKNSTIGVGGEPGARPRTWLYERTPEISQMCRVGAPGDELPSEQERHD